MSASWVGGSDRRWRKLRLFVLDRDGFACQINGCGAFATHVDHVVPLSKGGSKYDDRNCRAACSSCNLRRGARTTSTGRRVPAVSWSW